MQESEIAKLQSLIEQAKLLVRKNADIQEATGGRFNMFRVCGVDHYETLHSKILAEFLNPRGSHGLHEKLLSAFLATIGDKTGVDPSRCAVKTEVACAEGRMDILVEEDRGGCIVIENKLYAADGDQQIVRYSEFIKNKAPERRALYYLTLSGKEAAASSGNKDGVKVEYTPISYSRHILEWLGKCIQLASEYPMVRETLRQYRNHLTELLGMNSAAELEEMMGIICRDRASFVAASRLACSFGALKDAILTKHVAPLIKDVFTDFAQKYPDIHADSQSAISITPDCPKFGLAVGDKPFKIVFQFESSSYRDLWYGITKQPSAPWSLEQRPGFKRHECWECYRGVPDFRNWDENFLSDMLFNTEKQAEFKCMLMGCLKELSSFIK